MRIQNISQFLTPLQNKINSGHKLSTDWILTYKSAYMLHLVSINAFNLKAAENYFQKNGIKTNFNKGSEFTRKFVAFCSYHAAEIMKQLKNHLPTYIGLEPFEMPNILGITNCRCSIQFNTFEKKSELSWETMYIKAIEQYERGEFSSPHFMSTFLHEFSHSLLFHSIYKKFGAPFQSTQYKYNLKTTEILDKICFEKVGMITPYGFALKTLIKKDISSYGADNLAETFAEGYSAALLSNMDLFKLRLTKNPFKSWKPNSIVEKVLKELLNAEINDGKGLI